MISAGLAAAPALAQTNGAQAIGSASAQIVTPLEVAREQDLAFGAVFANQSAGTVTVRNTGGAIYQGGAQPACSPDACNIAHPALFLIHGEPGRDYRVEIPAQVLATGQSTQPGGGSAIALIVDQLQCISESRPRAGGLGQLDTQGFDRFRIGGTLHLPAGLPPADYRAVVQVIVTYS
jgi:hypothetical protein